MNKDTRLIAEAYKSGIGPGWDFEHEHEIWQVIQPLGWGSNIIESRKLHQYRNIKECLKAAKAVGMTVESHAYYLNTDGTPTIAEAWPTVGGFHEIYKMENGLMIPGDDHTSYIIHANHPNIAKYDSMEDALKQFTKYQNRIEVNFEAYKAGIGPGFVDHHDEIWKVDFKAVVHRPSIKYDILVRSAEKTPWVSIDMVADHLKQNGFLVSRARSGNMIVPYCHHGDIEKMRHNNVGWDPNGELYFVSTKQKYFPDDPTDHLQWRKFYKELEHDHWESSWSDDPDHIM